MPPSKDRTISEVVRACQGTHKEPINRFVDTYQHFITSNCYCYCASATDVEADQLRDASNEGAERVWGLAGELGVLFAVQRSPDRFPA